ncbi:MAG: SAM-dependent methyltransferase [Ktedonobacteraceae bacterium]
MTPLQLLIIERIQREGPLSFADYMRMALYEPGHGYYVTGPAKMGWEGDYYTSTDITDFFANCMGCQLQLMWEKLGKPDPFIVLEQGAGRGDLASGVRSWVASQAPDLHTALDYRTEDIHMGVDATIDILFNSSDAEESMVHVILSNELVDAFPVHIVEVRDKHLYELYVDAQDGHLFPVLDEPGSDEVASYLDNYKIPWATYRNGWRAEINLDALQWVQRAASILQKGYLLTIDYGDRARALYSSRRQHGTLICYYHHQTNEQPLARPGQQDITAHVNFSVLIDKGRQHGLRLNAFTTQRQWLENMGIHTALEQLRATRFAAMDTERASDKGQIARLQWMNQQQRVAALTDPAGMGNFKVLIMRRP